MDNSRYESSSLYFVAAMVGWGCDITKVIGSGKRKTFVLQNPPGRVFLLRDEEAVPLFSGTFSELFTLFSTDKLMFSPSYHNALRSIKTYIHEY